MVRNSVIINFCIRLYESVVALVLKSAAWGVLAKCNNAFNKCTKNSLIVNACTSSDNLEQKYCEGIGRFPAFLSSFFNKIFEALRGVIQQSAIVSYLHGVCDDWFNIPLIMPGITALLWGILGLVGSLIGKNGNIAVFISIAFATVGLFFVVIKKSVAESAQQSIIISNILKLFDITITENCVTNNSYNYKFHIVLGVALGIVSCLAGVVPVCVAALVLLFVAFGFYFTTFAAWLYVCILPFMPTMVMVAGGLALFACVSVKSILGYKKHIYSDGYSFNMLLLFMGIAFAIAALFSHARSSSIKIALVYIAFLCAGYALIRLISEKKLLISVLNSFSFFSLPVSILGIYQHFSGFDEQNTWIDTEMFQDISGRVVSFFENPNVFGEYLILAILTSVVCFFIAKNNYVKLIHFAAIGLSGISLIFTYSRGCWIGVLFAVVIFLFMSKRKVLAAFCVLGLLSVFFLPDSIITRIASVGDLSDSSTSYRVYIWQGTLKMLKDFWVTGVGLGSDAFNSVYPAYALSAIVAPHPHNLYLLILSESGIVGAVAFAMIVVFYYKRLFRAAKVSDDKSLKIVASGLIAAMSGYLLQGLFDNVWYNYRVFLLFWIFIALGAAVDIISRRKVNAKD